MKILSIHLKNLASLAGEHFIDFESQPLANAGLIAIVGKTGAGKSTILDAMCLALFNKIPRLKNSDGKLLDVDGTELPTHSTFNILRRNTGHGFAELRFIAQDQKIYLARWEIKRSKEKSTGKLPKAPYRCLTCVTDNILIADKTKAVDDYIKQVTQLSFEQFTRAVLLAQSEVTIFLKARDAERGELLEYLTNSTIFGQIGQLAFEKTKQVRLAREQLQDRLGHIEILSDEEFLTLQQKYTEIQNQYTQLEQQKNILLKQQHWFEHKQKLDHEMVLKQQALSQQQRIQQGLNQQQILLNRLDIFATIRPTVMQHQENITERQKLQPNITILQQQFDAISQQYQLNQQDYLTTEQNLQHWQYVDKNHQQDLNQIRHYIQESDFLRTEYKKIRDKSEFLNQQKIPLMQQQQDLEQQIYSIQQQSPNNNQQLISSQHFSTLDQGLNIYIQQIQRFQQQYKPIEDQLDHIQQAKQHVLQQQNQLEDLIQQFGNPNQLEQQLEQLQQDKEQQQNTLHQLKLIQDKLQQYLELDQNLQTLQQQQTERLQQQQEQQQLSQQRQIEHQTAKQELIQLQQILQQQRLLHSENIEHLRLELQENQPCLVCGSTQHPYRENSEAVSKALFELQQQQEQSAIAKEQNSLQQWQHAQQNLAKIQLSLEQNQQHIQQTQDKFKHLQHNLEQHILNVQLDFKLASNQNLDLEFAKILKQYQDDFELKTKSIQDKKQQLKQQNQLLEQIKQQQHLLDTAQQLQHQIQDIINCLNPTEQQEWQQQPYHIAIKILQQLQQRLQQLNLQEDLKQQIEQLLSQQEKLKLDVVYIQQQQQECERTKNEIIEKGKNNNQNAMLLIQNMTNLTVEKPSDWLKQYEQQGQQYQANYQNAKQDFEQIRQYYEQQQKQLDKVKIQSQHYQQHIEQTDLKIQMWLKNHIEFQQQDFNDLLNIDTQQQQEIRQILSHAEKQINDTLAALNTIQGQLDLHLQQQPNISLDDLQQQLQNHQISCTETLEQQDQYKIQFEVQQQNQIKRQQFAQDIEHIQQEEHRWHKISSLMGDATGKKFRDYAQQYHLDILIEYANQQLVMLSQRYTLKRLDNSLSLAIVDHDMDGETRSVASLSGGESFLTALALSLAIANMASGSMKIESLFIDEGFGTLDASSLHLVMNALDQLQYQGRKVVLISHIQEMHERIPVQIQVNPLGAGASQIKIVG